MESDIALARHVTFVHQFMKNPELDFEPFDPKFLKLYISQACQGSTAARVYLCARDCLFSIGRYLADGGEISMRPPL